MKKILFVIAMEKEAIDITKELELIKIENEKNLKIFRKNNIKVPEDVGIIGFDNIAILDNMSPRLTSVDCNIKTTGRKATTNLIRMINGEKDIKDCVVDYNIVEGETL